MTAQSLTYYGMVFAQLADSHQSVIIRKLRDYPSGTFLINDRAGLLIKYATRRKGPWGFTFAAEHKRAIEGLSYAYEGLVIALVCGRDGIAAISYNDISTILTLADDKAQAVSVRRRLRRMYSISGPVAELKHRVSKSSLPNLI